MKKIELHWQILIAIILAVIIGTLIPAHVKYISWMGDIFLRALKMVIIPLVFSSIVTGVANIGSSKNLGRLGLKTITYYIVTSILAITTGLILVNIFKPGVGADLGFMEKVEGLSAAKESFGSTLMNIIPKNIFEDLVQGNMLPIIFFALFFGFFLTRINEKGKNNLSSIFNDIFEVMMKMTMFIIAFTPLGILGIVSKVVAEQVNKGEDLFNIMSRLGLYMVVVLLGLMIHSMINLPVILRVFANANPLKQFSAMKVALLTAFSTSSSSATLPLTMESVEENAGVSNTISSFTLPLGATINMDGTALYECVAAMFIAQAYGIDLSITQQVIVVFTALLASIGAAGIPMAGLVMITVILSAVGLPMEGVGLILAVDRILDMCRTTVNVWSDSCGAVVIAKSEGENLKV